MAMRETIKSKKNHGLAEAQSIEDMVSSDDTHQGHPMLDFRLSLYEINNLKKLWNDLDLVRFSKEQSRSRRLSVSTNDEKGSVASSGSWQYNGARLIDFEYRLCSYVHHLEHQNDESSPSDGETTLDYSVIDSVRSRYQVTSMIILVSTLVDHLEFNRNPPTDLVMMTSKRNARIWSLGAEHYNVLGESMVLTLLEILKRDTFSVESELTFIRFYSRLASILLAHGKDPALTVDMEPENVSTSSPSSSTNRSSYEESQLSLYTNEADDSISLLTIDQGQDTEFKGSIDDAPDYVSVQTDMVEDIMDESQDEDSSYDLLNSFDANRSKKKIERKKSKTLERINRLNPRNMKLSSKRHSFIRFPDFG